MCVCAHAHARVCVCVCVCACVHVCHTTFNTTCTHHHTVLLCVLKVPYTFLLHCNMRTPQNLSLLQIQLLDIQQFLSSLKRRRQLLLKNLSTLPKLESVSEDHIPATQRLLVANTIANMQERVSSFVKQQSSDV